jgi:hypothetical protein
MPLIYTGTFAFLSLARVQNMPGKKSEAVSVIANQFSAIPHLSQGKSNRT